MAEKPIEVELRYKVHDTQATMRALAAQGIRQTGKTHLIDQWFAPTGVKSMADEVEWFDHQHGVAWRIRRTEQPDGSLHAIQDSKQLTSANNHDTFHETPPVAVVYDDAVADLANMGYRCWLTIDKTRYLFDADDPRIEIVLDEIKGVAERIGVGAGLEVEFKGQGTREQALQVLHDVTARLGLNESDRFKQSFTVEAMQALADFKE